jgi:uncharacterized protein
MLLRQLSLALLTLLLLLGCSKSDKKSSSTVRSTPEIEAEVNVENDLLAQAVIDKDLIKAEAALTRGASPDHQMSDGETVLTYSINTNQQRMIELLLFFGALIEKKNASGDSPVMAAVKRNFHPIARILKDKGANLDVLDAAGETALIYAIKHQFETMSETLIEEGASIYLTNDAGQTPLEAAQASNLPLIVDFITALIDLDDHNPSHNTVVVLVKRGDIVRLNHIIENYSELITANASPNLLIIAMNVQDAIRAPQMVLKLLEAGSSVEGSSGESKTPLIHAAQINSDDYVGMLVSFSAQVNKTDETGKSALIHAVSNNNPRTVDILLGQKASKKYEAAGKKFNACDFARSVGNSASGDEKDKNKKIKSALKCGLRGVWPFIYFDL